MLLPKHRGGKRTVKYSSQKQRTLKRGGRGNQENWSQSRGRFESDKVENITEINWKVICFFPATSVSGIIPDLKCDLLLHDAVILLLLLICIVISANVYGNDKVGTTFGKTLPITSSLRNYPKHSITSNNRRKIVNTTMHLLVRVSVLMEMRWKYPEIEKK